LSRPGPWRSRWSGSGLPLIHLWQHLFLLWTFLPGTLIPLPVQSVFPTIYDLFEGVPVRPGFRFKADMELPPSGGIFLFSYFPTPMVFSIYNTLLSLVDHLSSHFSSCNIFFAAVGLTTPYSLVRGRTPPFLSSPQLLRLFLRPFRNSKRESSERSCNFNPSFLR